MAAAKPRSKDASSEPAKVETPRKKKKQPKPPREVDPAMPWRPWLRVVLSLAILYHLAAVFTAPWRLQTEPALPPDFRGTDAAGKERPPNEDDHQIPPFLAAVSKFFRAYQNATYLNHGYDFFTPDPAGNFVIGAVAFDSEGQQVGEEIYPDFKAQWPRLFYHRHMMLAAQGREFGDDWSRLYGQQLLRKFNAERIHLSLNYHRVLTPKEVLDGKEIFDPSTYETLDEVDVYPEEKSQAGAEDHFRPIAPVRRDAPVRIRGVGP